MINVNYLMQYLSRQLHTIVRRFTYSMELSEQICERMDLTDYPDLKPEDPFTELLCKADPSCPVILAEGQGISYAAVITPDSIFLTGPILLMAGGTYRHQLPKRHRTSDDWLSSLHRCTPYFLLKEMLLLHNLFHEETVSLDEAFRFNCISEHAVHEIQKKYNDIVFQNQEISFLHNPYDQEIRELSGIQNGDTQQLYQSWNEDYIGRVGILAKDTLRHYKNLGIVLVTIAARAAIAGGVMSEIAFSLSDSYINKIEETNNPESAITLGRQAEYQYTLLVKEQKEAKEKSTAQDTDNIPDSRISRCKDYIFSHLHGKISTSEIAGALYMNAGYLSELFKKEEGITISEYILQEKLKLVKNMLIYSRYSYIEIANYLGFTSQSYLGAKFKKATGMTLHQYREKYGIKKIDPERT